MENAELHNFDCVAKHLNHIAVAKFGALAAFGLAIEFHNAVLDKQIGLRPVLADSQQLNQLVQLNIRL